MEPAHPTATATMMDQHVRNQMSIMAWVMAALCAWVLLLSSTSAHVMKSTSGETPYTVSVPVTTSK